MKYLQYKVFTLTLISAALLAGCTPSPTPNQQSTTQAYIYIF